jgi:hypothetical protein
MGKDEIKIGDLVTPIYSVYCDENYDDDYRGESKVIDIEYNKNGDVKYYVLERRYIWKANPEFVQKCKPKRRKNEKKQVV